MKTLTIFLTVAVLLLPASGGVQPVQANAPEVVVLTALDVEGAQDIEAAMHAATNIGTRPGTVILDGSQGPFIYNNFEGADTTINVFYSDLTLRGVNGAHVLGGEGIYFDQVNANHILIEDLALTCWGDCIISWGMHRDVKVHNMNLHAGGYGIQVAQTDGWTIKRNVIHSGWMAVNLIETAEMSVSQNRLSAYIGVMMRGSIGCNITNNGIHSDWQGILLGGTSNYNRIVANTIIGVESSGIALEPGTYLNKVHGNKVWCATGQACLTVDASGTAMSDNMISGNKP